MALQGPTWAPDALENVEWWQVFGQVTKGVLRVGLGRLSLELRVVLIWAVVERPTRCILDALEVRLEAKESSIACDG